MRTAQQASQAPPTIAEAPTPAQVPAVSPTPEGPSVLERFQQSLPSNQEYIEGGGLPGMALRGAGRLLQPFLGAESPPQEVIGGVNDLEALVRQRLQERMREGR